MPESLTSHEEQGALILAAEDCPPADFEKFHTFTKSDERLIAKLVAHGPVLVRGGRGSGKSALMIEANRRLAPANPTANVLGVYLSLRHLELLKYKEAQYIDFLCRLLIREVALVASQMGEEFAAEPTVSSIQQALATLATKIQRRIVLFFDDAAHIGREASLQEFFDIFRTISSSIVSCKAAIYPGVTRFGIRFDVYNDATVLDVSRSENGSGFDDFFCEVMQKRYPAHLSAKSFTSALTITHVAGFLGRAVLGNMRGFIFACNALCENANESTVGLTDLSRCLLTLASNYYWPLLEELAPKLGMYAPLLAVSREIGEKSFSAAAKGDLPGRSDSRTSVTIHRDIQQRLAKPLEILEYTGFFSIRDASRSLKSGGRGIRYAINLCNLLEKVHGSRLTRELFDRWRSGTDIEAVEFAKNSELARIEPPTVDSREELSILSESIDRLVKSKVYPYGLTDEKLKVLKEAQIVTIGQLAETSDAALDELPGVGEASIRRIRSVVGQAIWM